MCADPAAARAVLLEPPGRSPPFVKEGTAFFPGSSLTGNGLLTRWGCPWAGVRGACWRSPAERLWERRRCPARPLACSCRCLGAPHSALTQPAQRPVRALRPALCSDGEVWRRQRRLVNPAFRRTAVDTYAEVGGVMDGWVDGGGVAEAKKFSDSSQPPGDGMFPTSARRMRSSELNHCSCVFRP